MDSLSLEICQPLDSHGRELFELRSDPVVLQNSFHPEPQPWERFRQAFYEGYFSDPALPALFLRAGNERIGYLRFRRLGFPATRPTCDISIALKAGARGKGFAVSALLAGLDFLRGSEIEEVIAEVKEGNEASHKAFLKAGFELRERTQKVVADTGQKFKIARYGKLLPKAAFGSEEVFIIAEAGSNWRAGNPERDLSMGRRLIERAKEAGANCIKFQTYRPETVYVENAGESEYLSKAGIKQDIRSIFSDLQMPDEMVAKFAEFAREAGIQFMSTAFSPRDFAVVDPHVSVHKIASYEISHIHLLKLAARTKKPTILSTGASKEEDIAWAVETFRAEGGGPLCILQCTAKYPAPLSALNLRVIPWLSRRFGVAAGLSDHSRDPLTAPMAAVALGARVIEKHFTLHNDLPGPDHAFAVTPRELRKMVRKIREVEQSLGSGLKEVLEDEKELAAYARRGLQAIKPIRAGEVLRENHNVGILRPGKQPLGVHPKFLEEIEGKKAQREIPLGQGLKKGDW